LFSVTNYQTEFEAQFAGQYVNFRIREELPDGSEEKETLCEQKKLKCLLSLHYGKEPPGA